MRYDVDPVLLRTLIAVVDHGGATAAARQLSLTQSAVSQHLRKLEGHLACKLFERQGRRLMLTATGEVALGYARGILRMQDEMKARLDRPPVVGTVRLGTPDLYAAYLLPSVLGEFGRAFPEVQIELRCRLSHVLLDDLGRGEIDIALVTRQPSMAGGSRVRDEQLVWISGLGLDATARSPLPLAMLPAGNLYRTMALDALERSGRQWKVVCESASIGGLYAAVMSGLAVSVVARSTVTADVREVGRAEGLPNLPSVELILYRAPNATSDAVRCLEDYIRRKLRV
ncbi:LysR substrate-binding domain-containing protein [Algihabitans albus]|uniref:LysR substrate-binding domain-containing protein n=1 Tax=Algihabitans albus TaxID=2164067 RepID=UPI000E5D9DB2|nr:LysR substrate-binding domain-containing protein [Algihabitans albus]